jgi:hypothetical protein
MYIIISGVNGKEGHVAGMEENVNAHGDLIGKPKENTPLGRPKRRRDGLDWIELAENKERGRAFVNAVMNRRDPLNVWNFLTK